jgi:hypothetical protein
MAIFASLAMTPVGAQQRAIEPRMQLHAVNDWAHPTGFTEFYPVALGSDRGPNQVIIQRNSARGSLSIT